VKAGPKTAADGSPLPLRGSKGRELAVTRFASEYIRVPAAMVSASRCAFGPGSGL
jgi:hypothetical protein